MTSFQENCLSTLKSRAIARGLSFGFLEEKQGRSEVFVHGKLGGTEFWIYEDMADIKTGERRKLFEPPDYDFPQALIEAFVLAVLPEGIGSDSMKGG
ncbi:MAG: hypothetical protein M9910_03525 [Kiritimatiellae bacterium]|nr:hypothetical protein [Kiritimatiellia bacterium]